MRAVVKAILVSLLLVLAGVTTYFVATSFPSNPHPTVQQSSRCATSSGAASSANSTNGNWTTYHRDVSRSGVEPIGSVTVAHRQWAGPTGLDGLVYGEPLVCGDSLFVATESDSIYAINATTGGVLWQRNLGTPVPGSSLPCGNIDPSGITGTPVIDLTTRTLFVVAFLTPAHHVLFGLNIGNGSVRFQVVADPAGADPRVQQQRGALVLDNGVVYVPFGGLYGDCGAYHGWVVGFHADGTGTLLSYQVPTGREGGIWSPAGISVAANGDLLVATGNSQSTTTFDYGDSVLRLSPSLQLLDYFAPTNWAQLNAGDTDLGSLAPTIVPNGDVFQAGKEGIGFLLAGGHLGGIGGELNSSPICSGAYGGTARVGPSVLVPCTDGVVDVLVGASTFSVAWRSSNFNAGSPIVTGDIVWVVDTSTAKLLGLNLSTGSPVFSFSLGSVVHFCTASAAPGSLFVAAGNQLYSFALH